MEEKKKIVNVTFHTYASVDGVASVPSNLKNEDEIREYLVKHLDEVKLSQPNLCFDEDFELDIK